MRLNTDGLIIREQNIGERDKLVTVLTRDLGVIRAFVRGAKSPKSKKQSATGLLSYSKLSLYQNKDSYIIDEAQPLEMFFGLREDIERLSLAQYFSELALELVPEEAEAEEYLRVILNSMYFLSSGKRSGVQLKAITELRMLSLAGYTPNLVACERCGEFETDIMYFDMEHGVLYCENCQTDSAPFALEKGIVAALRHIVFSDLQVLYNFKVTDEAARELSFITEKYLLLKTARRFKTLEFYHSLF